MREKKVTITIEDDGDSVRVTMDGGIGRLALLHATARIVNQACEFARVSPEELFAYAEQIRMRTPTMRRGSWVTVPKIRRGTNGDD